MEPKTVEITVAGKAIQAREGETIIHALWQAGLGHEIQTGCVGGVCGACTVTLRFKDGTPWRYRSCVPASCRGGHGSFPIPSGCLGFAAPCV